jgi:Ca2+-transporting ATPase
MALANLAMILAARGAALSLAQRLRAPNPALRWVLGGASALLLFALATPPVARVFRFEWPGTLPLIVAALIGVGAVMLAAHCPTRD